MKILAINSVPFGSTGKIMMHVLDCAEKNIGAEIVGYFGAWGNFKSDHPRLHRFGCRFENRISFIFSYFTGLHNVGSAFNTLSLIRKIKSFNPDIIHIHNLHLWVINLPMLFRYIKKNNIRVIWTLHDCWSFTGQCPHFTIAKCDKWKTGCYQCPNYRDYPSTRVDRTKQMYKLKKKWFTGVKDMTIVTPSQWLADLVKESFLKEYPVKVINNGIDLSVFKPTKSNFRENHNISKDKIMLLGVAFGWGKGKGLDVMTELSRRLDADKYQIVLVGTDENNDKTLADNIISVHKTHSQTELAEIYTAADLFVNPTREEVFGLVNIEALACGTPVITFNSGGSPECIDKDSGSVVECDDVDRMEEEIIRMCKKPYSKKSCILRAQKFDLHNIYNQYIKLYEYN